MTSSTPSAPSSQAPIGVFDSGVGGLTVAAALKAELPAEALIYFGDTAHLPYGDKSPEVLGEYVAQITAFLLAQEVKAVVRAGNTASAVAFDVVVAACRLAGVPAFEVITPAVQAAAGRTERRAIGVIGTQTTIHSHVYLQRLLQLLPTAYVIEKATPLLVPLIEEGWLGPELATHVLEAYISDTNFRHVDVLILGCTHYPLLREPIEAYFRRQGRAVAVIDAAGATAEQVALGLRELNLLTEGAPPRPDQLYVSDFTASFQQMAERFFPQPVDLLQLRPGLDGQPE